MKSAATQAGAFPHGGHLARRRKWAAPIFEGATVLIVRHSFANPHWWGWHRFLIWEHQRRGRDV
jgi:hypothetical protein